MEIKTLKGLIADKGLTITDVINQMKMNRSTLYRKIKYPETFLISEIQELANVVGCSMDYLLQLLTTK